MPLFERIRVVTQPFLLQHEAHSDRVIDTAEHRFSLDVTPLQYGEFWIPRLSFLPKNGRKFKQTFNISFELCIQELKLSKIHNLALYTGE